MTPKKFSNIIFYRKIYW